MNRQPEITAQTKQNLIDAFWQLYCIKRIDRITVMEITTKAGYNRSTFYEYFTDVYDVLEQIEVSLLPIVNELPPLDSFSTSSSLPIDGFIKMYEEHNRYFIVLLGDNGDPSFQSKLKNSVKPNLQQLLIMKGAADNFELDYTLEYILSAMIGILSYWFRQKDMLPKEKLLKLMYEIMRDGVMNKLLSI